MPIQKIIKITNKVIYIFYILLYDRNLQRKTNQKACKVTYELLNDRNLQTKQIKKYVSPSSPAHFHFRNYDIINAYWMDVCGFWYIL